MTKAVIIHEPGGPEKLIWGDIQVAEPEAGQVLLRHTAIGLNYIDIYQRSGLYALPAWPAVLGMEAAGVIEDIGPGVDGFSVGDRVAYAAAPPGAYCRKRVIEIDSLIKLPDSVDDQTAAAMMLKGLTAEYLLHQICHIQAGDRVLIHAAAGGMGLILGQWAKRLGAFVIGTVGSSEKAALARAHGCDEVVLYKEEDIASRVGDITAGAGVDVVYDAVGRDTFDDSLACLSLFGRLILYGQASGPVEPFDPGRLSEKSASLARPVLFHYTGDPARLRKMAESLFHVVSKGGLKIKIGNVLPLSEAAEAHRRLESRQTTGSTVLLPDN